MANKHKKNLATEVARQNNNNNKSDSSVAETTASSVSFIIEFVNFVYHNQLLVVYWTHNCLCDFLAILDNKVLV